MSNKNHYKEVLKRRARGGDVVGSPGEGGYEGNKATPEELRKHKEIIKQKEQEKSDRKKRRETKSLENQFTHSARAHRS